MPTTELASIELYIISMANSIVRLLIVIVAGCK